MRTEIEDRRKDKKKAPEVITLTWNPLTIPKEERKKRRKELAKKYRDLGFRMYIPPRKRILNKLGRLVESPEEILVFIK